MTTMNSYEAKQQARRARLEAAAKAAKERSDAAYQRADMREGASGIPLGQPILVGHHSEARHRAAIKRADAAMRRSIEEGKKAKRLVEKAASVGNGGISSDDPEAVQKIKAKIAKEERDQAMMREANKVIRRAVKAGVTGQDSEGFDAYFSEIAAVPNGEQFDANMAAELLKPDFCNRIGFASYMLTNNNANIKRMKARLAELEKAAERETVAVERKGFSVVQNVEENRLQFIFDGRPAEDVRKMMKQNGFRWAPSHGAWQRQLTQNAIGVAEYLSQKLEAIA